MADGSIRRIIRPFVRLYGQNFLMRKKHLYVRGIVRPSLRTKFLNM